MTVATGSLTPSIYQCLVLHGMEGAIRVLTAGSRADALLLEQAEEVDALSTELETTHSEFDKQCGTDGLETNSAAEHIFPDRFVCGPVTGCCQLPHDERHDHWCSSHRGRLIIFSDNPWDHIC